MHSESIKNTARTAGVLLSSGFSGRKRGHNQSHKAKWAIRVHDDQAVLRAKCQPFRYAANSNVQTDERSYS